MCHPPSGSQVLAWSRLTLLLVVGFHSGMASGVLHLMRPPLSPVTVPSKLESVLVIIIVLKSFTRPQLEGGSETQDSAHAHVPASAGSEAPLHPLESPRSDNALSEELQRFLHLKAPSSTLRLEGITPEIFQAVQDKAQENPSDFPSWAGLRQVT